MPARWPPLLYFGFAHAMVTVSLVYVGGRVVAGIRRAPAQFER